MKKLELYELMTCSKTEDAFGLIADNQKWDQTDFCKRWLKSKTIKLLADHEHPITQSRRYYYNDIVDELGKTTKKSEMGMYKPAVEWFGYLTMYWIYSSGIKPEELTKYDVSRILDEYDILHTYSMKNAIEDIQENLLVEN